MPLVLREGRLSRYLRTSSRRATTATTALPTGSRSASTSWSDGCRPRRPSSAPAPSSPTAATSSTTSYPGLAQCRCNASRPSTLTPSTQIFWRPAAKPAPGGGLSVKTVRNIHTVLRKAMADAARKGTVPRNVAVLADPPPAQFRSAPRDESLGRQADRAVPSRDRRPPLVPRVLPPCEHGDAPRRSARAAVERRRLSLERADSA